MIEAVFESQQLKHQVFGEIEDVVEPDALLCSNTSTLPITGLATGVKRQADFIGLHFFSPVEQMPLVEIIVGEQTSDEALAKAYDVVRQIKKTPIVVNDSRGFFTSRVFGTLVLEGVAMLGEGIDPVDDRARRDPDGLPRAAAGDDRRGQPGAAAEDPRRGGRGCRGAGSRRVREPGHGGRSTGWSTSSSARARRPGPGFYDYPAGDGKPKTTSGRACGTHFVDPARNPVSDEVFHDLQERFTFVMSLETIKCVDEGVLRSTADANIGSIFGIGFPPLYGGALQYVNNYQGRDGTVVPGFLARARELAAAYGDRRSSRLPCWMQKAAAGERF